MQAKIDAYEKKHDRKLHIVKNTKTGEVDHYIIDGEEYHIPPPPPESKSSLDHVMDMAKNDADFYYDGKKNHFR